MKHNLTQLDSDRLLAMLMAEMKIKGKRLLPLEIDVATLFTVIGQIQLALRHPANNGASSAVAKKFVIAIADYIQTDCPATAESIRRGWIEDFDVEREPNNET